MPDNDETGPYTVDDVVRWMVGELELKGQLNQSHAAAEINRRFGEAFTYRNSNRNLAICKEVVAAFNHQTLEGVVWVRGSFMWRLRRPGDKPGRQQ